MRKRNLLRAAAGTAVLLAALTACGGAAQSDGTVSQGSDSSLSEVQVKLSDGTSVTCVKYAGFKAGGLSCDWEAVK